MKRTFFLIFAFCACSICAFSQISYEDSIKTFIDKYVADHEVVKGTDKKLLQFYPPDKKNRVSAVFKKADNPAWFSMPATGNTKQIFRVYGTIEFKWNDTLVKMNIYQAQDFVLTEEYKFYLFLPFTDLTTGHETYTGGRYIDLLLTDIHDDHILVDFNKAYNPYCAYGDKYSCPIPPKENNILVALRAGEKAYLKKSH